MKIGTLIKVLLVLAALATAGFYVIASLKPVALVATAKRHVAVRSVPGTVQVKAEKEMSIRSDLQGRVKESHLELGSEVKTGDLLIALDLGDIEIAIEKLHLDIEAAQISIEKGSSRQYDLVSVKEKLADAQRRFDAGIISRSELEAQERDLTEIEGAIEAEMNQKELRKSLLENELKLLERNREKMSIRSPIDGVVADVMAYAGDLISSGQQVATIISLDRIVEVKVSEENFSGIEVGQIARVKFLGYSDQTFDATVSKTLPVADPLTQRYTVHLDVDIPREELFSGLTGEATITIDEREQALIIPGSAIIGDRVFVVEEGVISIREIVRGYGSMTNVEILSGLEEGEQVVVDQLDLYKEGDKVRTEIFTF